MKNLEKRQVRSHKAPSTPATLSPKTATLSPKPATLCFWQQCCRIVAVFGDNVAVFGDIVAGVDGT